MKIFAVTVTYGNRFSLVKQIIEQSFIEGVDKIIVVDNNSQDKSKRKLKAYEKELGQNKIEVIYNDDNYGSSGGFKIGLEKAYYDENCEYIWLLDDDNLPLPGALKKLLLGYEYLGNNYLNIFYSFRELKNSNIKSMIQDKRKKYKPNSFLNFHIKNFISKKVCKVDSEINEKTFPFIQTQVAPYGGLFFSKQVITTIGFPNEDFFVYADDHDWTLRMTKAGFSLYLTTESKLKDIDMTWTLQKAKKQYYEPTASEFKIYYGIRNHTYLYKNEINCKPIFYMNMSIYLIYNYLNNLFIVPSIATKRFKLMIRAVKDGLNDNLGRTF